MYLRIAVRIFSVCICVYILQAAHSGALETLRWLLEAGCPVSVCDGKYICGFLYQYSLAAINLVISLARYSFEVCSVCE